MDYKAVSNDLLFKYHKNIDFVYKVLGEFLWNTSDFTKKFSKTYKTSEGKVLISWDKNRGWGIRLDESVQNDFKLTIAE